jgi:hypothetical protein
VKNGLNFSIRFRGARFQARRVGVRHKLPEGRP